MARPSWPGSADARTRCHKHPYAYRVSPTNDGVGGESYESGGRQSILVAPVHLEAAADHLARGLELIIDGDETRAAEHLRRAVIDWSVFAEAGRQQVHRRREANPRSAHASSSGHAKRPAIPEWALSAMFARDGWRCRYCGLRVIPHISRKAIVASCPDRFPWGNNDLGKHSVLHALRATPDHVEARSSGGADSIDNLVTACWTCQFQKGSYSLSELGLDGPGAPAAAHTWDGLESISREFVVWAAGRGRGWKAVVAEDAHEENPDAEPVLG